jgi:phosphoglycolate phosphatase-like HAD superfamily hydrolase
MRPIGDYATVVFDCDGVLLDSNALKTEAFRAVAARHFGAEAAEALVSFHVANGGVSRQAKFTHLLATWKSLQAPPPAVDQLCAEFGSFVSSALLDVALADGLDRLREACQGSRWLVVSGGSQDELRDVFAAKRIEDLFDGGIYGNPDPKIDILQRELRSGNIRLPAIYLGDSRLDHAAACEVGLDFCFVSGWTEFAEWDAYCRGHSIPHVTSISELVSAHR